MVFGRSRANYVSSPTTATLSLKWSTPCSNPQGSVCHAVTLSMPTGVIRLSCSKILLGKKLFIMADKARAKEEDVNRCRCCERQRSQAAGWRVWHSKVRDASDPLFTAQVLFFSWNLFFLQTTIQKGMCAHAKSAHDSSY